MYKRKKLDIVHIYAATAGVSGTYTNEVFNALKYDFSQEILVNAHYPFPNGYKIFYKFSERKVSGALPEYIRLLIRFFELGLALTYSFIYLIRNDVKILVYNLTSDLYLELVFLKLVKFFTNTKIIIVCHDVVPFVPRGSNLLYKLNRKLRFFHLVDYLIVHNLSSRNELKHYYNIYENILFLPFPIMDISYLRKIDPLATESINFTFLMIGYFRKEKGAELLIEAWKIFYSSSKCKPKLILCGHFPENYTFLKEDLEKYNIVIENKYLDDTTYFLEIEKSDVVILPYLRGTNSGVVSTVLSLGKVLLLSDIPLFKENELLKNSFFFNAGSVNSLASAIENICNLNEDERSFRIQRDNLIISDYRISFKDVYIEKFNDLLNN